MYQSFETIAPFSAPHMTRPSSPERRQEGRHAVTMPARLRSGLRLSIASEAGTDGAIADVIVTDMSPHGLTTRSNQPLIAGTRVTIDVPVIGEREAEIRWVADGRAGCRFVQPLREEELHLALCNDAAMARCFPGLMADTTVRAWGRA